jgi:putative endonuclease
LKRNFRCYSGEIDIIAYDQHERTLVFVEVKLRRKNAQTSPSESVDNRKIQKIRKTAMFFLKTNKIKYESLRFDVIGIETDGENYRIEHIKDAF